MECHIYNGKRKNVDSWCATFTMEKGRMLIHGVPCLQWEKKSSGFPHGPAPQKVRMTSKCRVEVYIVWIVIKF